jgi:hypothetical protein
LAHQKIGRYFHRVGKKDFHTGVLVSGNDVKGEDGVDGSKSVGLVVCKNCIRSTMKLV